MRSQRKSIYFKVQPSEKLYTSRNENLCIIQLYQLIHSIITYSEVACRCRPDFQMHPYLV